jgi:hypothetical protein
MELKTSDEILMYFKDFAIKTAISAKPIFSGELKYRESEILGGVNYFSTICQTEIQNLIDEAPHGVLVDILEVNLNSVLSSVYKKYLANYTQKENLSYQDFL